MIKKETAIIYIDRTKLLFYVKGLSVTYELTLNSDTITDLEITNREKFQHAVGRIFQTPSIKGKEYNTIIIFSPHTTFEKELTSINTKAEFDEIQKFLDMVPFEEVINSSYRINKKKKIVAANRIYYNILKQILEKYNAKPFLVLPMTVLLTEYPELTSKIDFAFIESKIESLKQYSLIDFEEMGLGGEVTNSIGIKKKDVRLYLMVVAMAGLFLILLFMIYTNFIAVPSKTKKIIKTVPKIKVTPIIQNEKISATDSAIISTPSSLLKN